MLRGDKRYMQLRLTTAMTTETTTTMIASLTIKMTKITKTTTTATITKTSMRKRTTALVKRAQFFHEGHCQVTGKYELGPQNH